MSDPYCGRDPSLSDKAVRELPRELSGGVSSFEFHEINSLAEQAGHGGSSLFGLLISCLSVQMDFFFTPPQKKSHDNQECWQNGWTSPLGALCLSGGCDTVSAEGQRNIIRTVWGTNQ